MNTINLPNIITFVRIITIPVFVTCLVYKQYNYALYVFILAGLSDVLDGLIARLTGQKTYLGAFLDPLADKFMLITSFILFSIYKWVPKWLTIVVISRDIIVILGWFLLYIAYNKTRISPSIIGKAANASQFILIAYILFLINIPSLQPPSEWLLWLVALLTISSGLQYIYQGLRLANAD